VGGVSYRNTIEDNYDYGVYADGTSSPFLGQGSSNGGYNSLYSNSDGEVYSDYSGTVYAEYNWWGQAPPDESQFQGSGMVDYDPWLTYDPNKIVPMLAASDPGILKADAFHLLEVKGKLQEAMEGYRKVIEDYPNSLAGRVSLSRLVRSYSKLGREWEVIPYLEGLAERHKDDELGGMASHLAAVCLLTVKL